MEGFTAEELNEFFATHLQDIQSKFTRLRDVAAAYGRTKVSLLKTKFEAATKLRQDLDKYCIKIRLNNLKLAAGSQPLDFSKIVQKCDEMLESICVLYHEALDISTRQPQQQAPTDQGSLGAGIRLPNISIPTFSDDIREYPKFIKLFSAVYGNNTSLTAAQKLYYLSTCLAGEAAKIVGHFPHTNEGYNSALNALRDRFECERTLAATYASDIFAFTPAKKATASSLKHFLEVHSDNVAALKSLPGIPDLGDYLLFSIASRNLDSLTRRLFEQQLAAGAIPTYKNLIEFVSKQHHTQVLLESENSNSASQYSQNSKSENSGSNNFSSASHGRPNARTLNVQGKNNSKSNQNPSKAQSGPPVLIKQCMYCKNENHAIFRCPTFVALNLNDRTQWVKMSNRCEACLSADHNQPNCKSSRACYYCQNKNHNSLLCNKRTSESATASNASASGSAVTCVAQSKSTQVVANTTAMLGTILCNVVDKSGFTHQVTCLLDTASEKDLICQDTVRRLGLNVNRSATCPITGVANSLTSTLGTVQFKLQSRFEPASLNVTASVLPSITSNLPATPVDPEFAAKIAQLNLADPNPFSTKTVEILLSVGSTMDILSSVSRPSESSSSNEPRPIPSAFGHLIMGNVPVSAPQNPSTVLVALATPLDIQMEKMFERDGIPDSDSELAVPDPADQFVEDHFASTHTRRNNGRFVVRLPFRPDCPELASNRDRAYASFLSMENRVKKKPDSYETYRSVLQDYFDKNQIVVSNFRNDYMFNQHVVFKRSTGKAKLVFDPTLRAADQSLNFNMCLLSGPKLQNDLNHVLMAARAYPVCLAADIETFYRAIELAEPDSEKAHIFARIDADGKVSPAGRVVECRLAHLCYGLSCSPFIALRCVEQLIYENISEFPVAAAVLKSNRYIDDLFVSFPTVEECVEIRNELTTLLGLGQFNLGKFQSSHPAVLADLPADPATVLPLSDCDTSVPVLGMQWCPSSDTFSFEISKFSGSITRRTCTSYLAKTYDSMGLLNPCIFWMKKFIQGLWSEPQLDWDTILPENLSVQWLSFTASLPTLSDVKLPRYVSVVIPVHCLAVFADASSAGYGCAAYLVSHSMETAETVSHLLAAKSKLAPQKVSRTIPQLELSAIELAAKLIKWIFDGNLPYEFTNVSIFSDSTIALSHLKIPVHKLKVFTANRVSKILELTKNLPVTFGHVSTNLNPADYVSRGLLPNQLLNNKLWFNGPDFLTLSFPPETNSVPNHDENDLPDVKPNVVLAVSVAKETETNIFVTLCENKSLFTNVQRTTAFVLRFINNCRKKLVTSKPASIVPPLSVDELESAVTVLVKYQQSHSFDDTIRRVQHGNTAPGALASLSPFLDSHGMLRVGGRLSNSNLPENSKHPLLIPKSCNLAILICRYYHALTGHSGPTFGLSLSRKKFWIVHGRSLFRSVVRRCVLCAKLRPRSAQPVQGNLPACRTEICFPFRNEVGIDAFGPYKVKLSSRRNSGEAKIWGLIFLCQSTRAVHLEPLSSMSAKDFLAAFSRFCSRRSLPAHVWADNGGNFTSGGRQLQEFAKFLSENSDTILSSLASRSVKFSHIPAYAPHLGGWEPHVKRAKILISNLMQNHTLYFEEWVTLFTRVEGILNSKPYLEPAPDPSEDSLSQMLCPASFLVGGSMISPPEVPDHPDAKPESISNRWDRLRCIINKFWSLWHRDVLNTLMQKNKWPRGSSGLSVGQLVWVRDMNSVPGTWPLAVVTQIYPDHDGTVRVVDVRTNGGTLRRAVRNLYIVPSDSDGC